MANRIDRTFDLLREKKRKGFIAYITAGDPTLSRTVDLALALEEAGADILELGVPFSDPLADGVVNQMAAQRALEAGATFPGLLSTVRAIRKKSELPIVLFTYLNPIYTFGFDVFQKEAAEAGVDGVLILDLPPDEAFWNKELEDLHSLRRIQLVAPTTPPDRMKAIVSAGSGFVYYVCREGVTGVQNSLPVSLTENVRELRRHTELPIAVGFGISTPEQAAAVAKTADAVVVGSAIVRKVAELGDVPNLAEEVRELVEPLVQGVKSASS